MVVLKPFSPTAASAFAAIATPDIDAHLFRNPFMLDHGISIVRLNIQSMQLFESLPFAIKFFKNQKNELLLGIGAGDFIQTVMIENVGKPRPPIEWAGVEEFIAKDL